MTRLRGTVIVVVIASAVAQHARLEQPVNSLPTSIVNSSGDRASTTTVSVHENQTLPPPIRLRVEGLEPHLAVLSVARPRFSFVHPRDTVTAVSSRGLHQKAYRITIFDDRQVPSRMVWDTGKVFSSRCSQIVSGVDLPAFGFFSFEVRWWRSDGAESAIAVARFETGPLSVSDWGRAEFLGGALLRTDVVLAHDAVVTRARAYVAAPGCHALEVNGRRPPEDLRGICPFMAPGVGQGGTQLYSSRIVYQTHNVTRLIQSGINAVGLLSGNVFTSTPSMLFLLRIELSNGTIVRRQSVTGRGGGWLEGPKFWSHDEYTSHFDWTKREPGWSSPRFEPRNASQWAVASSPDAKASTPPLAKQMRNIDAVMMPPSTIISKLSPIGVRRLSTSGGADCTTSSGLLGGSRKECLPGACTSSDALLLKCAAGVIMKIEFASWGTPGGPCGNFSVSACNSSASYSIVAKACLGKTSCSLMPSREVWGADPCYGKTKVLAVQASGCTPQRPVKQAEYMYTFGRNFVGTIRLAPLPKAASNSTISMQLGEWLESDIPKIRGGPQSESYTLVSGYPDYLETLFVWHGFQYVRVKSVGDTGFDGGINALTGLEIRTDVESVSSLQFGGDDVRSSTDAALFNRINDIARASMVSNVAAYQPTDCPTAEKRGYLGDASFAAPGTLWNFGFQPVYASFANVIADSQTASGDVPTSVPCPYPGASNVGCGAIFNWSFPPQWGPPYCNDIAWTSGLPIIVEQGYQFTEDTRPIESHWGSLTRYIENLISKASAYPGNVASCDPGASFVSHDVVRLGDWVAPAKCTGQPTGSRCEVSREVSGMSYVLALRSMANIAVAIGKNATAARYNRIADEAASSFHTLHWNNITDSYGGDEGMSQVLNVPALVIKSAPSNTVTKVVAALRRDLQLRTDFHLATGAVLSKWLLSTLSEYGLHDAAIRVATQTTFPSWGWWLAMNATTCWETWHNGTGHHDGIGPFLRTPNSHNHVMLCGGISAWFWTHLAGLAPTSPGFATFSVAPRIDRTLGPASMSANYSSPRGVIRVEWTRNASARTIELAVDVPVGVQSATVSVPTPFLGKRTVSESGVTVWSEVDGTVDTRAFLGVEYFAAEQDAVAFRVGSGWFRFRVTTV